MVKRTPAQYSFDLAKHGWAFCTPEMLASRFDECAGIAKQLAADDPRQSELESMRRVLATSQIKEP